MSVKSYIIAKLLGSLGNEETRNKIIIGITVFISLFLVIIFLPLFLILYPLEFLGSFFKGEEFSAVSQLQSDYPYILEESYKNYQGKYPMPIQGTITSDYGMRSHPVYLIPLKHTGIDISGIHRDNVIAIEDGIVTKAEIQRGYGNCVEIQHEMITYETYVDEEGNSHTITHIETFYSFYAHLSRIDVVEGMKVKQGHVIGIEGGDPKKDPNARSFNRSPFAF